MGQFDLLVESRPMQPTTTSHEGGTVHTIMPDTLLRRFLILGSTSTYYADGADVTQTMTDGVRQAIKDDPGTVLDTVLDVARNRLALRKDPTLYVHAMLTLPSIPLIVRRQAFATLLDVAPTGTDLLHWLKFRKGMGGKSNTSFRRAVGNWFLRHPNLALQAVKYDQRDGWSLRDALRLARPTPENDEQGFLFQWITHPDDRVKARMHEHPLIKGYALLRDVENHMEAASLVGAFRLPREAVPSPLLAHKEVWEALKQDMPARAFIRNLGKLASMEILRYEDVTRIVETAKVLHPFELLVAREVYASGKGIKGNLKWMVYQPIVEALDRAFRDAFVNLTVDEFKRVLVAIDTSASMRAQMGGTILNGYQSSAAIASVLAYQFPRADFFAYSQGLTRMDPRRRTYEGFASEIDRLEHIGTYCWLPLDWALRSDEKYDAVISITDNETHPVVRQESLGRWGGQVISPSFPEMIGRKVSDYVRLIQKQRNPDFRHAVVAMAPNDISIADAMDPRQLDIAGLGADVPQVLASFIRGEV